MLLKPTTFALLLSMIVGSVFNGSVNNPWAAVNATALLECNPDKKWYFNRAGSKFVVRSVRCFWG
ncbi:hypothetical protein ANCCAN_06375 [Ancylostoma caninum]|uniref:C6 domain-containing protein n=1 Tax=Ancylostoma caninum TaxID=29170 RepID=A0A368GTA0_ANCCA|nr:hypothetical protein ANCCAN_06375 [Ancylostoma caninum]